MIFSCSFSQHFSDFGFSARCFSSVFVLAIMIWFAMSPSASQPTYREIFGLLSAETDSFDQLDRYDFPSFRLIRFSRFSTVVQFGVNSSPICIVNRITRNGLFTLPVKLIPSSMFAVRCFNVCIAFSTAPFPVCI